MTVHLHPSALHALQRSTAAELRRTHQLLLSVAPKFDELAGLAEVLEEAGSTGGVTTAAVERLQAALEVVERIFVGQVERLQSLESAANMVAAHEAPDAGSGEP